MSCAALSSEYLFSRYGPPGTSASCVSWLQLSTFTIADLVLPTLTFIVLLLPKLGAGSEQETNREHSKQNVLNLYD